MRKIFLSYKATAPIVIQHSSNICCNPAFRKSRTLLIIPSTECQGTDIPAYRARTMFVRVKKSDNTNSRTGKKT